MKEITKKQIDDLLEYEIAIKNMFSKLATAQAYPNEVSDEEKNEEQLILDILDKTFEIEQEKISKMIIDISDIQSIHDYLLKFYDDVNTDDFLYEENHLERIRLYNKIQARIINEQISNGARLQNKNIDNAIYSAIDSNYIKVYLTMIDSIKEADLYVYLLYARLYISPYFDISFFVQKKINPILHYSHFKGLMPEATESEIKEFAKEFIHDEIIGIIKTLYDGYTNEALENPENEARAISNMMSVQACLTSTLDPDYIDQMYKEFKALETQDPEYSDTNAIIFSALKRSKLLVLESNKK